MNKLLQAHVSSRNGENIFAIEPERVQAVVQKLARGHVAYEISELARHHPSHLMIMSLHLLSATARQKFEAPPTTGVWPEIGSRAMQRMFLRDGTFCGPQWVHVQDNRYRYLVVAEGEVLVRFVVSDYLACEVIWNDDGGSLEDGVLTEGSEYVS